MKKILFFSSFIGFLFFGLFLLRIKEHRWIFFMLTSISLTIFFIIIYYMITLKKKKNIITTKEISIDSPENEIKDSLLGKNLSLDDVNLFIEVLNRRKIRGKIIYYELLRSYMGIEQYDIKDFQTAHRHEIISEILRLQNSSYFEFEWNCHKGLRIYMDETRVTGIDMLEKMGEKELLEAIIKCENRLTEIFKNFRYVLKIYDSTKFYDSSPKILLETENKEEIVERFICYLKNPIKDKEIVLETCISNYDKLAISSEYVKSEAQLIESISELEEKLKNQISS